MADCLTTTWSRGGRGLWTVQQDNVPQVPASLWLPLGSILAPFMPLPALPGLSRRRRLPCPKAAVVAACR